MILGMSLATFTAVHVVLSLIGIVAGLVVLAGMQTARRLPGWTALFLGTTVLTSVTGFLFPFKQFGPPHVLGVISLVALAIALLGLYVYRLARPWRWLYVGTAVLALYLNVFVGVVQAFQKLPALNRLAPTQSEPPFTVAQLLVLALFLVWGIRALRRFHPAPRR
jgi:magnesium-transporting ATPase (P-type)